jgi:uncharacterized protein YmfQ (DUF2313 family)
VNIVDALRGTLPPVAYAPNEANLSRHIAAEAKIFESISVLLDRIHASLHPDTAIRDIAAWEHLYGLIARPDASSQQRIQAVQSKQAELGGLSKPYFEQLARAAGYAITILEPAPFEVGRSRCGEALYTDAIRFVWVVVVEERPAGATPSSDALLEATFHDLKAAHTFCQFQKAQRPLRTEI